MKNLILRRYRVTGTLLFFLAITIPVAAQPTHAMGPPPGKGKPAKITWSQQRLVMEDFAGGNMVTVSFTSDKDISAAALWLTGGLDECITIVSPASPFGVTEGIAVDVTLQLNKTPDEAGRTLGGTVHVRDDPKGRTYARPLVLSLKRTSPEADGDGESAEDEGGESAGDEGGESAGDEGGESAGDEGGESAGEEGGESATDEDDVAPITWSVDLLRLEDFNGGKANITFTSTVALENVTIRLTEEVGECISVTPQDIAMVGAGETVPLQLMLTKPEEELPPSLVGTIQVRNQNPPEKVHAMPLPVMLGEEEEGAAVAPAAIVSAASFEMQPISGGQIVSVFGVDVGPDQLAVFAVDPETGRVPSELSGISIFFDGFPAAILAAVKDQVNVIVPTGVEGEDAELLVVNQARLSAPFPVAIGPAAPGLFTLDGSGRGQAAAMNEDGTINGNSNPVPRGAAIVLWGTGAGPTEQELEDGEIVGDNPPRFVLPVKIVIGGEGAEVLYSGAAPTLVNGVGQWNARVPEGLEPGVHTVVIDIDGVLSSNEVTIVVE